MKHATVMAANNDDVPIAGRTRWDMILSYSNDGRIITVYPLSANRWPCLFLNHHIPLFGYGGHKLDVNMIYPEEAGI
jgi:hypothetical protein